MKRKRQTGSGSAPEAGSEPARSQGQTSGPEESNGPSSRSPGQIGDPGDQSGQATNSASNDATELGSAARALGEAARALTLALRDSFQDASPRINEALTVGLREAAQSIDGVSQKVKTKSESQQTGSRARRSEKTREDLLMAAAEVITEKGYSAASVEDIAAAAGYTKGAVYTHFATKRELFAQLAVAHLEASQPLPEPGTLAAEIAKSLRQQTDPSCVLLTLEILALAIRDEEFRRLIGSVWIDALEIVAGQVAANRGARQVEQADRDTAIGLVALINLARALAFLAVSEEDPEASIELTTRLVTRLLEG